MGIKKNPRPSAALKDSNKRSSLHNRPQINKPHIMNKEQAEMSMLPKRSKDLRFRSLFKIFDHRGMAYGRCRILRTGHNDWQLRHGFLKFGIRSREGVEQALLELLFQCRNLKDWDSGGDNLVDVFHLIKGRVKWATNCPVDLFMQLFFTLLRARLDCPVSLRKNACKVALRVDQVISYINGVDHLIAEYEIHKNLVLPIHHAIRTLPKEAKIPPSAISGAIFLQGIGHSNN